MNRWHLVYTKPRKENKAEENLLRQGYGTYLPWVIKRSGRGTTRTPAVEPLFPRYLFVNLDAETQSVAPIRSTFGVSNLISFGGRLTLVPAGLVDKLRQAEAADGLHRFPMREYCQGQAIQIVSGPFAGLAGIFQAASGAERVSILLDILGKTTTVCINRDWISPPALA